MRCLLHPRAPFFCLLALCVAALGGMMACGGKPQTDMTPLDQAGMGFDSLEQLRSLEVTPDEVQQLALMRQSGLTDASCVELIRFARDRQQLFADGEAIGGLLRAGMAEPSVLELARLNQLGLWAGVARALRLAGLSDDVILSAARRRAAGQPVLSGPKIAALKNVGMSDGDILAAIERGATDAEADRIIASRTDAAGGRRFVRPAGRRRR